MCLSTICLSLWRRLFVTQHPPISLPEQDVERQTGSGEKYLKKIPVSVIDEAGGVVAEVDKVVYFRLKKQYRPTESARPDARE